MLRVTVGTAALLCAVLAMTAPGVAQESDLPQPPVISAPADEPPSDAVVLFDGSDLDEWIQPNGGEPTWVIEGDAVVVKKGGIMTKREFGDVQLHLEFATPSPPAGEGQGRGNSGVYLQGKYECQVLDSYNNETYADGMVGAIYQQHIPLVNPSRPPGVWQVYDIVFRAPRFDSSGKKIERAKFTVFLNGILIQDHVLVDPTPGGPRSDADESAFGPLYLQDHTNPVKFRNIWVREL